MRLQSTSEADTHFINWLILYQKGQQEVKDAVLRVRMLGTFSISYGDVKIAYGSRSYKNWLFLAYLILHRDRMVPRSELVALFGDGDGHTDPNRTLRNRRMRARQILAPLIAAAGRELIVTEGDACGWSREIRTELDAEEFSALCATSDSAPDSDEKIECFRRALALFRGELLEMFSTELWVCGPAARYHELYLDTVERLLLLLEARGAGEEAAALCRDALRFSPYDEGLYRHWMRALMRLGKDGEAAGVFEKLRALLADEMDVAPEDETRALYQEALRRDNDTYIAPESIRESLREQTKPEGAVICDYSMFKLFYQVEARSADRRGDAIHIGILSAADRNGKPLTGCMLDRAMEQLRSQIQKTLRIGDVAACCSASQYLILLVQANLENSQKVCARISDAFRCAHPRSAARIRYTVLPLEPLLFPEPEADKTAKLAI